MPEIRAGEENYAPIGSRIGRRGPSTMIGSIRPRRLDRSAMILGEQATPGRAAALVAEGVPPEEMYGAITAEAGALLGAQLATMVRLERDGTVSPLATWSATGDHPPLPDRLLIEDGDMLDRVAKELAPVRVEEWSAENGQIAEIIQQMGGRSSVCAPILLDRQLWGWLAVHSYPGSLAPYTDARVGNWAQLLASAMSNARARAEIQQLADEQAARRRVATLVAQEPPLSAVFSSVAEELATLLGTVRIVILRYDGEGSVTATWVASAGGSPGWSLRVGTRFPLEPESLSALVLRTGQPARIDDYSTVHGPFAELARDNDVRAGVATPITVRGRRWGAIVAVSCEPGPLPPDTELRVGQFTDLLTAAIRNAKARSEVARLADEQAALRRVAALVAKGSAPAVVFDAVTSEVAALLGADQVSLARFEPGPELTMLARRGRHAADMPVGARLPLDHDSVSAEVLRTGRSVSADIEDAGSSTENIAPDTRATSTTVGMPVVVDGRLWGSMTVGWTGAGRAPSDAEQRLKEFAALLDVAIANADSRAQLTASRARMLTAGDDARRRVVRDLHDGAQQRLVHTIVTLTLAWRALDNGSAGAKELVAEALEQAGRSNVELRQLAHGILPAALTRGGLRAGVNALASRLDLPVTQDLPTERFSQVIEAGAYFVVAEALMNVRKHAQAQQVTVRASVDSGMLTIEICDDGIGGADLAGNGLAGIEDRVLALGGRLRVESPSSGGTVVSAVLPTSQ
jgi:signal transduction histidine kinase